MREKREIFCRVWTSNQDYQDLTGEEYDYYNGDPPPHRTEGPAIEHLIGITRGLKIWIQKGQRHRLDGPAYIDPNGYCQWWKNGKLHRLSGPAIEWPEGQKEWWVNNQRHRTDGPAVIYSDGGQEWWINNHPLDQEQVERWIQENSIDLSTKESQIEFVLRWS